MQKQLNLLQVYNILVVHDTKHIKLIIKQIIVNEKNLRYLLLYFTVIGEVPVNPFSSPPANKVKSIARSASRANVKSTNATATPKQLKSIGGKGKQKVFKQIEILSSGSDDSEGEQDYVPPRHFDSDSDDDKGDKSLDSDSEPDDVKQLEDIMKNVPLKSSLSRKRKVKTSKGMYVRKEVKKTDYRRAKTPQDRVNDFPDDCLSVVNGNLSCRACNMFDLALKHSSVKSHVRGEAHKANLVKRDKNQLTLLSYKKIVVKNERSECAAGATLPIDVSAYRMSVAHGLLKSGYQFLITDLKCVSYWRMDMLGILNKPVVTSFRYSTTSYA